MSQSRNWCFTVNNYETLIDASLWDNVRYCIYQEEVGDNGTPHLQGYLQMKRGVRLSAVKKLEGLDGAHLEVSRGTPQQAIEYCRKKDETYIDGPYEWGTPSLGQGSRNDLLEIQQKIKDGKTSNEIAEEHFGSWCRYNKSFEKYQGLWIKHRTCKPKVYVLFGGPGVGKTYWAKTHSWEGHTIDLEKDVYFKDRGHGLWWDGYIGQKVVVLDEFSGWMVPMELNRLCDENPQSVQTKGGFVPLSPEVVVITTNLLPHQWWKDEIASKVWPAFTRRVDEWQWWSERLTYHRFQDYGLFLEKYNSRNILRNVVHIQ